MPSTTPPMPAVAEFMTRTVHTVSPDAEVNEAVAVLTRHVCSGAPVVDAMGRIVGVLTHEGCMRALSGAVFNGEEAGHVADAMAHDFVVIEPTADLFRVVSMFANDAGRRILVADAGKLVGIVTRTDTLRALHQLGQVDRSDITIESVAVGWSALTP
jgi:predicted transcriptional regulator